MTCREFNDFSAAYLANELPSPRRAAFEEHLRGCPECAEYLKSYRQTVLLGKGGFESPDETLPRDVPERLLQAILAARRKTEA